MSLYQDLKARLPEWDVELVTVDMQSRYAPVFDSNRAYYLLTDGRPASEQDRIDTIAYGAGLLEGMCFCIGFSRQGEAVALLSILEGYPDSDTLYIGLLLVHEAHWRKGIGSRIIRSLIDAAFGASYRSIQLSVQDNNPKGCSFWHSVGFQTTRSCACEGFCNLSMELQNHSCG